MDYIPTQYICNFVKIEGYSSVEYNSTMRKSGINLTILDENLFSCIEAKVYDIKLLEYKYGLIY